MFAGSLLISTPAFPFSFAESARRQFPPRGSVNAYQVVAFPHGCRWDISRKFRHSPFALDNEPLPDLHSILYSHDVARLTRRPRWLLCGLVLIGALPSEKALSRPTDRVVPVGCSGLDVTRSRRGASKAGVRELASCLFQAASAAGLSAVGMRHVPHNATEMLEGTRHESPDSNQG